jgi:ABC-type transport system involved in multi-copper enzyme maturation permease subunit
MTTFSRTAAVAANTFRETVRQRVLYNLVFFVLALTISGLVLRDLSISQDNKIIKDLGLAAMDVFGVLIAILIGINLMIKELERRSLYPLLARPLTRAEFIVGKFAGLAFTLLVNITVMTIGLYGTLLVLRLRGDVTGTIDLDLLKAVVGIFAGLLLTVAVALFFSVITNSGVMAAISTVVLVIMGRFSDVIRNMQDVLPGAPGWLTRGLYHVLPNFHHFDLKDAAVHGLAPPWSTVGWISAYGVAYSLALIVLAIVVFRRKDV